MLKSSQENYIHLFQKAVILSKCYFKFQLKRNVSPPHSPGKTLCIQHVSYRVAMLLKMWQVWECINQRVLITPKTEGDFLVTYTVSKYSK